MWLSRASIAVEFIGKFKINFYFKFFYIVFLWSMHYSMFKFHHFNNKELLMFSFVSNIFNSVKVDPQQDDPEKNVKRIDSEKVKSLNIYTQISSIMKMPISDSEKVDCIRCQLPGISGVKAISVNDNILRLDITRNGQTNVSRSLGIEVERSCSMIFLEFPASQTFEILKQGECVIKPEGRINDRKSITPSEIFRLFSDVMEMPISDSEKADCIRCQLPKISGVNAISVNDKVLEFFVSQYGYTNLSKFLGMEVNKKYEKIFFDFSTSNSVRDYDSTTLFFDRNTTLKV